MQAILISGTHNRMQLSPTEQYSFSCKSKSGHHITIIIDGEVHRNGPLLRENEFQDEFEIELSITRKPKKIEF